MKTGSCLSALFLVTLMGTVVPAAAQPAPRVEVSGGYQFFNVSVDEESESFGKGWYADIAANLTRQIGIVFEVGGSYKSQTETQSFLDATGTVTAKLRLHEFMGGLRVNFRQNTAITPFGQVLAGGVHGAAEVSGSASIGGVPIFTIDEEDSTTNFGLQVGGGANIRVTDGFGVRAGFDYLRIFEEDTGANVFRFTAGVVIPFPR